MARLLKVLLLVAMVGLLAGCGQKGDLYMPSEKMTKALGL